MVTRNPATLRRVGSALAGFHPGVLLINHIDPAMTAHDAAILVAGLGRTERITDLHDVQSR
jgi:hypothetical protein